MLPGKTPPIITPEGTFYVGDPIQAELAGFALQGTLVAAYTFTDQFGLNLQVGWMHAFLNEFTIKAGEVELKKDSPALVKNDGTATQAGIDPQAMISGWVVSLALIFSL